MIQGCIIILIIILDRIRKEDEKIWANENPADPKTWKWTTADKLFLKLIQEVHKRGNENYIRWSF